MNERLPAVINGRNCYLGARAPIIALIAFYSAFNGRDLAAMERNWWTASEEAAMFCPRGGLHRGWPAIREAYERIFSGPTQLHIELCDYALYETGDVFHVAGRERAYLTRDGREIELAFRTSRVFWKRTGRWYQVHHHGSIDDLVRSGWGNATFLI